MSLFARDPEKFAVIMPYPKDDWDDEERRARVTARLLSQMHASPEVDGILSETIEINSVPALDLPTLGGLSFPDPENWLWVRATAMAYPKEGYGAS